jgi:DNA-binding beta-propeller fold protein YncE
MPSMRRWSMFRAATSAALLSLACRENLTSPPTSGAYSDPSRVAYVYAGDSIVLLLPSRQRVHPLALDSGHAILPDARFSFRSRDTTILPVSSDGLIVARRVGLTWVVVTSGHVRDSVRVAVRMPPIRLGMHHAFRLTAGDSVLAGGMAFFTDGTSADSLLHYSSSNTAIFTVSSLGVMHARAKGTAMLYVRADTSRDSAVVTIDPLYSVIVTPSSIEMPAGDDRTIGIQVYRHGVAGVPASPEVTSTDTMVLTTQGRSLHALRPGQAWIRASYGDGADSSTVLVRSSPQTFTLSPRAAYLAVGWQRTVVATFRDSLGGINTSATLSVDDPGVASLSSGGVLTGVSAGSTWLRAVLDTMRDSIPVIVSDPATAPTSMTSIQVNGRPYGITAGGGRVLVTDIANDELAIIDPRSGTVTARVAVSPAPIDVQASLDGRLAYVLSETQGCITVVDIATASVVATWSLPAPANTQYWRLLRSADGTNLYVTTSQIGIVVVDARSGQALATAAVSSAINGIAESNDGRRLYVSDIVGGRVLEVDALSLSVQRTLFVGGGPQEVVLDPDGARLYVARKSDDVAIIDLATFSPVTTYPGSGGFGMVVTPDSWLALSAVETGMILVLDVADGHTIASFRAGTNVRRIAFDPVTLGLFVAGDDGRIYVVR